ncbi:histidine kinase [Streptomyces sp. 900116325]
MSLIRKPDALAFNACSTYSSRPNVILGPPAVGFVVAVRRDLTAATQARVADLEREQLVLDERARAEERAAIAREMHDVVGHRVGNMVLAAGALQVGPAAGHPDVLRTAELIRSDGRQASRPASSRTSVIPRPMGVRSSQIRLPEAVSEDSRCAR